MLLGLFGTDLDSMCDYCYPQPSTENTESSTEDIGGDNILKMSEFIECGTYIASEDKT